MAKNIGKIFEQQWRASTPDYILLYRLPDPAQSFGDSATLRFSRKNPFDYLMWDSIRHLLYALELKTVSGKSVSFERSKEDKGVIHHYQIIGLQEWNKFDGIICGFIIEFRDLEMTIFIDISDFLKLMDIIPKKSFNVDDLDKYAISYTLIGQTKQRTRFKYHVDDFLNRDFI